ncbi:MAG: Gfo/Idh/MocA family oxidoreductase [Microbacteriaceae bacterium]|nr:Gfo/Idh/MocA family oxidoreductase [Microbacteriaceae bacterium]HOW01861.1 Gfo/Idh/MocA family oxidoreductase [Rhodoglobus sp.]HQI65000.1 Gfo/Idh/MocA family oxidoreductase [Rhodoglobus sp.]HQJ33576.1 Gfo/Idh/MocA family oxidoreductase [Rhodoglobus sp.]
MGLRAGVLGLGVMGRHHSRLLNGLDGVDFLGVYDPAESVGPTIEGKPVVRDLGAFLDMGFDYCVVAAPTIYHLDIGRALAERGIHALIEKPVASTAEDATALRDLFDKAGLIGGVGHIERYNPALQSARERIEAGLIGDIYQIATRRQGPFPGRIADVGVIKDLASHDIDLTAWVTQQEYVSVNARTAHRSGRDHEDMLIAIGTLSRGTIASHTVNWLTPFKERTTIITGELGALVVDTLTADLTHYQNGVQGEPWASVASFRGVAEGDITRFALVKKEPLLAEHEAFRDAVLGETTEGIVTLTEGTNVVRIAESLALDGLTHEQPIISRSATP